MSPAKRRTPLKLDPREYQRLAAFRHALRGFLRFSEMEAEKGGPTRAGLVDGSADRGSDFHGTGGSGADIPTLRPYEKDS